MNGPDGRARGAARRDRCERAGLFARRAAAAATAVFFVAALVPRAASADPTLSAQQIRGTAGGGAGLIGTDTYCAAGYSLFGGGAFSDGDVAPIDTSGPGLGVGQTTSPDAWSTVYYRPSPGKMSSIAICGRVQGAAFALDQTQSRTETGVVGGPSIVHEQATCPAGYQLTGGGGAPGPGGEGGFGGFIESQQVPGSGNTWSVAFDNTESTINLQVVAVCLRLHPLTPAVLSVTHVRNQGSVGGGLHEVNATCPAGYSLVGGGSTESGQTAEVFDSAPGAQFGKPVSVNTWSALYNVPSGGATIAALAMCARVSQTLPRITGVTQAGDTLSTTSGAWSEPVGLIYKYSWKRCDASGGGCGAVGGNSSSYTLRPADVGHLITVTVTASDPDGNTAQETARAVGPIVGAIRASDRPKKRLASRRPGSRRHPSRTRARVGRTA